MKIKTRTKNRFKKGETLQLKILQKMSKSRDIQKLIVSNLPWKLLCSNVTFLKMFPIRPGLFSVQNSESPRIQGPPDRWFHINFSDKMVDCMKRETFDISKVRLLRSRGMLPVIYSTHHLPHVNNRKSNHYDDGECPHGPGYDKIIFFHAWPFKIRNRN